MNVCQKCGKPCQHEECPDCRYRDGRSLGEAETPEGDLVQMMIRHTRKHFRDGFSSDQLQQVSPAER